MTRFLRTAALLIAGLLVTSPAALVAQHLVITLPPANGGPSTGSFSGFGATPISPTAVLQSYMDAAERGATLGYAVVIRGPARWYNTRTSYGEIASDSLPPDAVGQWWRVGERSYEIVYDRARQTLTLFDTVVDLRQSRVVLVTVPAELDGKATVVSGQPVAVTMGEPTSFSDLFLPRAPEVRAFAGLEVPVP